MHIPVFFKEIEEIISKITLQTPIQSGVDCTFGFGGHSKMLSKFIPKIIAFDQDPDVFQFAKNTSIQLICDNFSNINQHIEKTDLILADLGLSTMQLDSNRGFSFMTDTPLDMRMNKNGPKLKEILARLPRFKIIEIIKKYGEEPLAGKIGKNIESYRLKNNIQTTFDLRKAIGIDKFAVLARVFQAFRIFLNEEINSLEKLLEVIPNISETVLIISFHSLEDRLIKQVFKKYKFNGFFLPTEEEILANPRSRSAKLRFASNIYDISKYCCK